MADDDECEQAAGARQRDGWGIMVDILGLQPRAADDYEHSGRAQRTLKGKAEHACGSGGGGIMVDMFHLQSKAADDCEGAERVLQAVKGKAEWSDSSNGGRTMKGKVEQVAAMTRGGGR